MYTFEYFVELAKKHKFKFLQWNFRAETGQGQHCPKGLTALERNESINDLNDVELDGIEAGFEGWHKLSYGDDYELGVRLQQLIGVKFD